MLVFVVLLTGFVVYLVCLLFLLTVNSVVIDGLCFCDCSVYNYLCLLFCVVVCYCYMCFDCCFVAA